MALAKVAPGLKQIRETEGMSTRLAAHLGVTRQAVSDWKVVPISRLTEVEDFTGIDREQLRPDLFKRGKRRGPKPGKKRK